MIIIDTVSDSAGNQYNLIEKLGGGTQGSVFRADGEDKSGLVVKLVEDPATGTAVRDEKHYKLYRRMVERIMALPEVPHLARPLIELQPPLCGYVMRLMEKLEPMGNRMRIRMEIEPGEAVENGGLRSRMLILRNLARIMRNLHCQEMVYGDLSPSNIFVSKQRESYEVWLIDPDNLAFEQDFGFSIGTPYWRAPEIVRGERNTIQSDCYSFALIAYEFLTGCKPFDGEDVIRALKAQREDFADDSYDKIESGGFQYVNQPGTRNKPLGGLADHLDWVMTPELQELFLATFGDEGKNHPESRPSMQKWLTVLDRACELLVRCSKRHAHFGCWCPWCGEKENVKHGLAKLMDKSGPVEKYYALKSYHLRSIAEETEDGGETVVDVIAEPIYEKRWNSHQKTKKTENWTITVPWKALELLSRDGKDELPAFELRGKKGEAEISGCYDYRMKAEITQQPNKDGLDGLTVLVEYKQQKFRLEVKKDE